MNPLNLNNPDARPLRVLCLGAHSDDLEIGCGGSILGLTEAHPGMDLKWVIFGAAGVRAEEAQKSGESFLSLLPSPSIEIHGFQDGFFPAEWPHIKKIFEGLKDWGSPDLILTHTRDDRHQDHRVVSDLTWNTFRDHFILEYEIPKYDGDLGQPNVFVDIPRRLAGRKVGLLMEGFASQRSKRWFTEDTFYAMLRIRGIESGTEFSEAFYGRKMATRLFALPGE